MQEPVAVKLDDKVYPKDKIFLPDEHASLSQLSAVLHGKIAAFLKSDPRTVLMQQVQRQTETSLGVLKEALDRYGLEKLAISYNGGKDCLVLLILWLVVLHKHYGRSQDASSAISTSASPARLHERFPDSVNTVYIQSPHSFVEVDDFVRESSRQYRLNLCTLNKPMKEAFEDYLQMRPKTEAIFVGTRRTDPHGAALSHFNPTDGDWPKFMRCQPVIDWHYREIWGFIRHFDIPYCRLYDLGFTSLGGIEDTFPNPRLKVDRANNDQGGIEYRPAYELLEDDEERLGRNNKS